MYELFLCSGLISTLYSQGRNIHCMLTDLVWKFHHRCKWFHYGDSLVSIWDSSHREESPSWGSLQQGNLHCCTSLPHSTVKEVFECLSPSPYWVSVQQFKVWQAAFQFLLWSFVSKQTFKVIHILLYISYREKWIHSTVCFKKRCLIDASTWHRHDWHLSLGAWNSCPSWYVTPWCWQFTGHVEQHSPGCTTAPGQDRGEHIVTLQATCPSFEEITAQYIG